MPCAPCASEARVREHRAAVSVPQDRRPLPWPSDLAAALQGGMKGWRTALLHARAWLRLQPNDAHRAASFAQLQAWEQQLMSAEQSLIRTGVADAAVL